MASTAIAILKGARIVRVHDVKSTVDTARVVEVIRQLSADYADSIRTEQSSD